MDKEENRIQHTAMEEMMRKKYYRRILLIQKNEVVSKVCIDAIKTLALPVVQYIFNIIGWKLTEIQRLDKKSRKLLVCKNKQHPTVGVAPLYLHWSSGEKRMMQLE